MEGPCGVCGKPSGPCMIKGREKNFFCIYPTELFEDHVTIPCYIREQFNKWTSNIVTLIDKEWYEYTVQAEVTDTVTVLHGKKWQELVADYGFSIGDTLMVMFPRKDESFFSFQCRDREGHSKPRLDKTVSADAFNSEVDYKLQYVCYTKGISLSDVEKEKLCDHIECNGFGAAGFFVHRISRTNIKECLKLPEVITSALRQGKVGQVVIYVSKPECESTFNFRVDTDGRMAIGGSMWKDFAAQAKFKINELISVIIFKEPAHLVLSIAKLQD